MAIDDLWYLSKRDPETRKKLPSKRHGRGNRWRVRWTDPISGEPQTMSFERKSDAEVHNANVAADISRGLYIDPAAGQVKVKDAADTWRANLVHNPSTAAYVDWATRLHITPVIGHLQRGEVRSSHIRSWVKDREQVLSPSTLRVIYSGVLSPMFQQWTIDRAIGISPCIGIKLPPVYDPEYTIATEDQVHGLSENLPERFRAIPYLVAGCGWRAGEVFGAEDSSFNFLRREAKVDQQLKYVQKYGQHLDLPKTRTSKRVNELPAIVAEQVSRRLERFPLGEIDIMDRTDRTHPAVRRARLLFLNDSDGPMYRANWSRIWRPAVRAVGLPPGYGLRDLRHYFATLLIFAGANVKTVQLAMGHATPTITLNVYTGLWPDAVDRTRSLVDAKLGKRPPGAITASSLA